MDNIKPALTKKNIATAIFILILEIALFVYIVKSDIHQSFQGGWQLAGLALFFPGLIFSIPGVVLGVNFIRRKKFHLISLLLLLISFCSLPIPFGGLITGYFTNKIVQKERAPEIAREKGQALIESTKQQDLYKNMLETFKQPQQVIGAYLENDMYPVIVLNGANIIAMPEMNIQKKQKYIDFISWINKTLVGKEVQVVLPNSASSAGAYIGLRSCDDGIPILVQNIRQKFNLRQDVGYCSLIAAREINYNGQGLYGEYLK